MYYLPFIVLICVLNLDWVVSQKDLYSKNGKFDDDDSKSSLVFVFDTTGSMYNDLRQLREGAEMILKTALEESNVIADFVFVPFHDPAVGPAIVTRDKTVFKAALNVVRVYGGGDCPEKSLGGIQLALNVSRPRSYVYVFTDATAADHKLVGNVLDAVQRTQSQVVFLLTGHCNDLHKPSYKVYQQIAAASSGQIFNLNKTNLHMMLDFVKSSIKARTVNLGSIVNPAGYNYTKGIPVDRTVSEVTVSVSGAKPQIKVVDPKGTELTGPPKLITILDLSEIMIVKVLEPEPGNWTITVGSEKDYSVKVVGLSNLTFNHGFSVETPASIAETSYRPLQGTYNYMVISLTQTESPVDILYAEMLDLDGKPLFEVPLKEVDRKNKIYLAQPFLPPKDFFYIAINGLDEHNQELRRVGATAVHAKLPDIPYSTAPKKVEAHSHERVVLQCNIESLVPVTAAWIKDGYTLHQISSLQSTVMKYSIEDMKMENAGTYICAADNVAGQSHVSTVVKFLAFPPQMSIAPDNNITVELGSNLTIKCTVISETLLLKYQLIFNASEARSGSYAITIPTEPNMEGIYNYNKTIRYARERDSGMYTCVALNTGGRVTQSTNVLILSKPTAQILGPHTLTKHINTHLQLVCNGDRASMVQWIAPNGSMIKEHKVDGSYNVVLDVRNVTGDGVWSCVAFRGSHRVMDSVEITTHIKPRVTIEGAKNLTLLLGTKHDVICRVTAKPEPRIIWHKETEKFLNNTITLVEPNVYKSILTLDGTTESVKGTYFCFGENSEGIEHDNVTVGFRRKINLLQGFTDKSVELYSQVELHCQVDTDPSVQIKWYHNDTELIIKDNVHMTEDNFTIYIQKVDFGNFGFYACVADNGHEKVIVNGTLSVHGLESPALSKEPVRRTVQKGRRSIISCRVLKGNPEPSITWLYKNETSAEFTKLPPGVNWNEEEMELIFSEARVDHAGLYRCVAENILGKDAYDVDLVVQYPPQLSDVLPSSRLQSDRLLEDKPLEIEAGQKVVFSCKAVGIPLPIVVWTKDEKPVLYSNNVYLTDESDLVIDKATVYDSGVFTCNATSAMGSAHKDYALAVYVPPSITPPGIEPQVEVLEGQLVELPCNTKGVPPPEVTWLHNGNVVQSNRKYVDEFGLRFVANLTDFGEYTCIAKSQYGNASLSFSLYIWVAPYIEPPVRTKKDALLGINVTLSCDAVGFPIPDILWEFQNELLTENTTDLSFNAYGSIYISNASAKHEGLYVCIAENIAGYAQKFFHLNVNEPPKILEDNYTGPYIATNLDSSLVISCKVSGKPKPFVIWSKDELYLDKDSRYDVDVDGSLTIKSPSEELSGQYTCLAKNDAGFSNRSIAVEIYSLPTQMQADETERSVTVLAGANTTIECPIKSSDKDLVKWYKDAKLISEGPFHLTNTSRHNASQYACVVTNTVGSAYSMVNIVVEYPPVFVNKETQHIEVVRGDDWYFDCEADAKPRAKTKWLFNGRPLLGEDDSRLKLMNIQRQHVGAYACVVNNVHGTIVRKFSLDVLVPPFISEFDMLDVQLKEALNATLECNSKGSPEPNITWTYNNTNWKIQDSTLVTSNITVQSEGLYRCDAINKAGATHIVYRVGVVSSAKVTEVALYNEGQGVTVENSTEVVVDTRVRLACKASGKPSPTVQWIRNGNILSESDEGVDYADLVLDDIQTAHSATFSCIASNEGGSDERKVKLNVLEPPKIFHTLFESVNSSDNNIKVEVLSGQAFYLHCHPYGNPVPEVYWFKDGLPLRLYDESMVTTDYGEIIVSRQALYEQSGNYTCVARNRIGNSSVVYLVDVLVPPPTPKESSKPINLRIGKDLNLTCPVEGSPLPNVVWVKHPYTELSEDTPRVKLLNDNYTLVINKTEVSDSGKYSCVMTNKAGTTEYVFDVTIEKAPSIAGNVGSNIGESHTVPLRRSIVLKCEVDGHPLPKINWMKDTQQISESLSNINQVLGNSLLAIWSMSTKDVGQYICVAENGAGTSHRRYNVAVKVPGKWGAWSQWTLCNVTCGLGYQLRTRICQYVDDHITIDNTTKSDKIILDDSACKGSTNEKRKCHLPLCEEDESQPKWSVWSKWSQCSSSCGVGTHARTRRCKTKAKCLGDNVQIKKCTDLPKCNSSEHDPSENEVYGSKEEIVEANQYMPEATFEIHPEEINSYYSSDVEQFYVKSGPEHPPVYYDVNVTENLDRSERGPCDFGYSYNMTTKSCDDIDECPIQFNKCHATQLCVNTAGGYRCTCAPGYVALGAGLRCLDINECEQDIHGCEYACVNVAGGYVCACPRHLRLHTDKHHCVEPASYRKPYYEEIDVEDYLGAYVNSPARYTKNVRNHS